MVGRVFVKILGPCKKGQRIMTSDMEGVAVATDSVEGTGWILQDSIEEGINEVEVSFTHTR